MPIFHPLPSFILKEWTVRKFSFIAIFIWFISLDVSSKHVSSLITLKHQAWLFLRDGWPWMLRQWYYTTFLYARVIGRSKTQLKPPDLKISAPCRFIDKIADFHNRSPFCVHFDNSSKLSKRLLVTSAKDTRSYTLPHPSPTTASKYLTHHPVNFPLLLRSQAMRPSERHIHTHSCWIFFR